MIKKLVSHLGEYKRAAILTPILSALEAIMDAAHHHGLYH